MKKKHKFHFDEFDMALSRAVADIAANKNSTAVAVVNQEFSSRIDKPSDVDWIKVNLTAGRNTAP